MSDRDEFSRRSYLTIASGFGLTALSGCLRFAEAASGSTPTGTPQPTERSSDTPESGENTYDAHQFRMQSLWGDGMMRDPNTLSVSVGEQRIDVDGSWTGNDRMFYEQACARYSFELLENGEVLARTGEKILIVGYNYAMDQTEEALFVTYQPSVNDNWDIQLLLQRDDVEYSLPPTVHSSRNVLEFDLTAVDAEPGEYEWEVEIAPRSDGSRTGFPAQVGITHGSVAYVPPYSDGWYSSRSEAIATAAASSESSATPVSPPRTAQPDGLEIVDGSFHGGGSGDSSYHSKNFYIDCRPVRTFGGDVDRSFRAINHTLGTSNEFVPE